MKLSVLYHSKTGNTRQMAEVITSGMMAAEGAEARSMPIEDIDAQWLRDSRCIVVGTPIYVADVCGEMKSWMESAFTQYDPAGKIGGAFATVNYIHGGGELGIRTLLDHMLVYGMLTYSGGGAFGKPVVHLGPVARANHLEEDREAFVAYGQRMAKTTMQLFGSSAK